MSDNRNYDVTNKIFKVLDNVKGFDVAMKDPKQGKLLVRYNGVTFYMTVDPVFNDTKEGNEADSKPFEEIVRNHSFIWREADRSHPQ